MADYSLVPVEHQPDFENVSLVPVEHDPFSADDATQRAPTQPAEIPIQSPQTQRQAQQAQFPQPQPQPAPQTQLQQPATKANEPGVTGPANGNDPGGSGGVAGIKRFGGAEGGDFPSRNAGIGFESAERAWDAAAKEMRDLGVQHYPEEAKSSRFIPELGIEIFKRGGLYYYDKIARGYQDGALGGGVGFGDSGAVARGHMHWDDQRESTGDLDNARAYSQRNPDY